MMAERVYGPAAMPAPPTGRARARPSKSIAEVDIEDLPLARLIREARVRRSLSLDRLATLVNEAARSEKGYSGATRQTVHKWERGLQTPNPDAVRWIAVALAFRWMAWPPRGLRRWN
jgi:DNA-binding transcriptional regulator YiaG